jgi:serine protease
MGIFTLFILSSVLLRDRPLEVKPHRALEIPDRNAPYVHNQVLVSFKDGGEDLERIRNAFGAEVVYIGKYANFEVWKVDKDPLRVAEELRKYDVVYWAEPHYIRKITWTPNDPYFPIQWNLDSLHCNLPFAWDFVPGGSQGVKIGILDTGIAFEYHQIPEYELDEVVSWDGFYHPAPDLSETHFSQGYDAVHQDNHPNDQNGHGTHVAGIIAQTTNNGYGTAGISFNSTLVPIQGADYTGTLLEAWIIDGIGYAVNSGVKVLNMSFGGADSSHMEHLALIEADERGIILVASTGNSGSGGLLYPAAFPEVISVGATDWADSLAYYSTYGLGIDLVAPGGNLEVDLNNDGYPDGILQETYYRLQTGSEKAHVDSFAFYFFHGTSMAAPHVSAASALLVSLGVIDPPSVKDILIETSLDLGPPGYDIFYGYGRLRVDGAVNYVIGEIPDTIPPKFEIWILQDAYETDSLNIWISSNETLYDADSPPDSLWLITASDTVPLQVQKIAYRTYKADYTLNSPGEFLIRVKGRDLRENWGIGERSFEAFYIGGETRVSSKDGFLEIQFSGNEDFWFTLMQLDSIPGFEAPGDSPIYLLGPWGYHLENPVVLKIYTNIPFPSLLIMEDSLWVEKTLAFDGESYEIYLRKLGAITVKEGNPPEEISLTLLPSITRGKVVFEFSLSYDSNVNFLLYDVAGRLIKRVKLGYKRSGTYRYSIELDKPSGIYIAVLRTGDMEVSRKMVVIR